MYTIVAVDIARATDITAVCNNKEEYEALKAWLEFRGYTITLKIAQVFH